MKVNLKKFAQDKYWLENIQRTLLGDTSTKAIGRKLKGLIDLVSEIETDLELGGESIVELDKPRLDAIEERNKMLKFMNEADDI
jgi:hypothetical protein